MATERYIHGKKDDGKHDGRYSNQKRLEEAMQSQEVYEQLQTSIMVWKQREVLPKEIVDYHRHILEEWGLLDNP